MKGKAINVIVAFMFIAGLSILLYPTIANLWNQHNGVKLIAGYDQLVDDLSQEEKDKLFKAAEEYNKELAENGQHMKLSKEQEAKYKKQLRIEGSPIVGYVQITNLHIDLPLFLSSSDAALNQGVGHLDFSSLPVGGKNTHCVLSGHTGLPSARLFTDIINLREGDRFALVVLGKRMTYEVDQIRTVIPQDTSELMITEGKDYCTLVTCTPYGINTHRLLVRGHRIPNEYNENIPGEAIMVDTIIVSGVAAVILLLMIAMYIFLRRKKSQDEEDNVWMEQLYSSFRRK